MGGEPRGEKQLLKWQTENTQENSLGYNYKIPNPVAVFVPEGIKK